MPIDPFTASALISAGSSGIGFLADRFLNQRPDPEDIETPDLTGQADEVAQIRRAILNNRLQRQQQNTEDAIASQGLTGTAAANQRQAQIDAANQASQQLDADTAEAMRQARIGEEQAEFGLEQQGFQQDLQRSRQRSAGIGRVVGGLGQLGSTLAFNRLGGNQGSQTSPVDTFLNNPLQRTRFDQQRELIDPLSGNIMQGVT